MKKEMLRKYLSDAIEKHNPPGKEYQSSSPPDFIQEDLFPNICDTQKQQIYRMKNPPPPQPEPSVAPQYTPPLPLCFNGDPNLQLPGVPRRTHTHMPQTIFHTTYRKPMQELIKERQQQSITSRGDLPSWDDSLPKPLRNTQTPDDESKLTCALLAPHIMHYQEQSDIFYPTVFPHDLRRLLYVFHDVLRYPLHLWHEPDPDHIHKVALITGADDRQLLFCYKMALEQYLSSNPPLAPPIQSFPKRSNF